ncbi:putative Beta-xylosidase [Seiridium cardinale]
MPFNEHHRHQPSISAGEALDPTSPMDTDFSVPQTPMDSVFSQASTCSSPMDISFPDSFPSECSTSTTTSLSPISPRTTSFTTSTTTTCSIPTTCIQPSTAPSRPVPQLGTPSEGFSAHRGNNSKHNPAFAKKLQEMALPLAPLVQLTTGQVHASFPSTLLNFWLLTDSELESLAHFYHQRTPSRWTFHYPCPVSWDPSLGLEEKRRRIGKFIGLRGCETPVKVKSEDEIMEEARRGRERDDEDEVWRKKLHWY